MPPKELTFQTIRAYWPVIVGLSIFLGSIWLAVNVHNRQISDILTDIRDLRTEMKEMRTTQIANYEKLNDSVQDIRVKFAEAIAILKDQKSK